MNKLKAHFKRVLETKTSAHSVAAGFAIGTFIAILPTPGLSILIGTLIVLIFKDLSKYSLFGAMVFWNPLTLIPVYALSYKIGSYIFGGESVIVYKILILDQIYNFTRRFLVGNLILALTLSITSYFLILIAIKIYDKKQN